MDIVGNFTRIEKQIPDKTKIIAVSKTKPDNDILTLYNYGHKIFGENKVQELISKYEILPKDIEWHFIGHLQSNKVKYIAPFVSLIHSIDSFKLLKTVNKEGFKNNRMIDCLLQFYVAQEETKYGLTLDEAYEFLDTDEYNLMKNIRIRGVMGMASYTNNQDLIRKEFIQLKKYFDIIKEKYFCKSSFFSEISMGMSEDYQIAIEEGSTMVRIGSLIFGERTHLN